MISTLENHLITLKPRIPDYSIKSKNYIPGPGAYNPPASINANGHYIISKQINCKSTIFYKSKSKSINRSL